MRSDTQPGTQKSRAQRSPAAGDRPGPTCARSPPTPVSAAHPVCVRRAATKRSARWTAGTSEPPGGRLALPPAGVRQRSPPVPPRFGGSSEGARQLAPQSPQRPTRSPPPQWTRSSLTPSGIPRGPPAHPGSAASHQSATCQRFSEPRAAAAAAAVALVPAAAPPPSWLRPEVTSARRPQPRHRPRAVACGSRLRGAWHDFVA